MARPVLLEWKKAATKALIIEVADRLFMERGSENVTLEEVADQCEVWVRTVLRYFEAKEVSALAFECDAPPPERFKDGLAHRTGDVLGFWRCWVGMMSADLGAEDSKYGERVLAI